SCGPGFEALGDARAQEYHQWPAVLTVLRHDLQRDQAGYSHHDACDSPEPPAEPERQKNEDRVEFQPLTQEQRLHDLTFDCRETEIGRSDREHTSHAVKGHECHHDQHNERCGRPDVRDEVEYNGEGAPQDGVWHVQSHNCQARGPPESEIDECDRCVVTAHLSAHGVDHM